MSIPVPPVPSFPPAEKTLTSVKGLRAAGVRAGIKASGNPDVALLVADAPMAAAALFTQNHFAARCPGYHGAIGPAKAGPDAGCANWWHWK